MIQRIQTLFLGALAIAMIGFLFFNIWQKTDVETTTKVTLNCLEMRMIKNGTVIQKMDTYVLAILAIVAFALAVVSILSFKNRMRQLQIGLIISIVIAGLFGGIVYFAFEGDKWLPNAEKGSYGPGLLIPAFAFLMNSLANRFIRRDETIVRESNRMR